MVFWVIFLVGVDRGGGVSRGLVEFHFEKKHVLRL